MENHEPIITATTLEAVTGVRAKTAYELARSRRIPFYRVGFRGVRFKASEVLAALRQPTADEEQAV